MKLNSSLLVGLSFSVSALAYTPVYDLQKRTCSKNNLYRTLERLQRESAFCEALLVPSPTVIVPSSIAATPIATISSACNCIIATLTTSSTTTTSATTSSVSVCANTVTITPNPVTVTKTLDPITVTETYTTTSTPTQAATSHSIGFEEPDRRWGCSTKSTYADKFDLDFIGCGEHEDPAKAHSGDWFYRASFYAGRPGTEHIIRFGTKKAFPILPGVDYEFSLWYRQFGHDKSICTITIDGGNKALPNIAAPETVDVGFGIFLFNPTTSLEWTKSSRIFNTKYSQLGVFVALTCKCPAGNQCGYVSVGFDDITIKPLVSV